MIVESFEVVNSKLPMVILHLKDLLVILTILAKLVCDFGLEVDVWIRTVILVLLVNNLSIPIL